METQIDIQAEDDEYDRVIDLLEKYSKIESIRIIVEELIQKPTGND